jgi:membrane protease YdiL (CAAX protease family)
VPQRAVGGCAFALLYQRFRSLWPAVAAHAGFNLLALLPFTT